MAVFKDFNEIEQKCWDEWKDNSMTLPKHKFSSRKEITEWAYQLGIQPGTYLYKKTNSLGYMPRPWNDLIEVRFQNPEDLAFIKLGDMDEQDGF